jgi:multisubunit Na+/H+ antiporter MnhB subunit
MPLFSFICVIPINPVVGGMGVVVASFYNIYTYQDYSEFFADHTDVSQTIKNLHKTNALNSWREFLKTFEPIHQSLWNQSVFIFLCFALLSGMVAISTSSAIISLTILYFGISIFFISLILNKLSCLNK